MRVWTTALRRQNHVHAEKTKSSACFIKPIQPKEAVTTSNIVLPKRSINSGGSHAIILREPSLMTQDSVMLHVEFIAQVVTVQTKTCRFFRSCAVSVTIMFDRTYLLLYRRWRNIYQLLSANFICINQPLLASRRIKASPSKCCKTVSSWKV